VASSTYHGATTPSTTTFSIMTPIITTLDIMILSITINIMLHSACYCYTSVMLSVIYSECHIKSLYAKCNCAESRYAECGYSECRDALSILFNSSRAKAKWTVTLFWYLWFYVFYLFCTPSPKCFKTFYCRNLWILVVSLSVCPCPWLAFSNQV